MRFGRAGYLGISGTIWKPTTIVMMPPSMNDRRDIIISIHPKHVANIISRVKNHEFRNYLLPLSVERLWIYETSPLSSIRFIATISHGKRPGEVCNPFGLGNEEFDRGDLEGRVKYAYEILKLEQLPTPYSLADLKANGWLGGAPQKYCFMKPSMRDTVDSLVLQPVLGPADTLAHHEPDNTTVPKRMQISSKKKEKQASLQDWVKRKTSSKLHKM